MIQALIGPVANLAGSWLQGKADKTAAEAKLKLTEAETKSKILLSEKNKRCGLGAHYGAGFAEQFKR